MTEQDIRQIVRDELARSGVAVPNPYGWIPWSGGECPVSPETIVDVRWRDGTEKLRRIAATWRWWHDGGFDDIVWYRICASLVVLAKASEEAA